jgi:hypothetical protein
VADFEFLEERGEKMPATYDLTAVRHFTEDLDEKVRQCETGEGMICATLEERINHYAQLCEKLLDFIREWARAVFTGQIPFDDKTETLLKKEASHLLSHAANKAALGRLMNFRCFELGGLNSLHYYCADLSFLLNNWVSPKRSVSPAPRVKLTEAAEKQIMERLGKLSA